MKRKDYEKPAMQVIMLQQRCQILTGSASDRQDYIQTEDNPFAEP